MKPVVKNDEPRDVLLRRINGGEFHPFFQPIVSLEDLRVTGFEMLARHISPQGTVTPPADFIPAMEQSGLLDELMLSLMAQGFKTAAAWPEQQFLSMNVSPSQLNGRDLAEMISQTANRFQFDLTRLKIEITETALLDDIITARAEVEALSDMGCTIAMDDFGTGYSSLSWLIQLPVNTLKIDSSFIRSMLEKKDSRKIISSVVGLGQSLDMDVIAEGVETDEQAEMLRGIGCLYAQGYLFGKPVTAAESHLMLARAPEKGFLRRVVRLSLDQRAHQISSMYAVPGTSICFLNPDLMIVDASDTFAERLGWAPQDVIHKYIYEVIPSQADKLLWLQEFRIKGLPYPPYEVVLPDGSSDLVMVTRVEDEAKDLLGFCVFGVKLTGRHGNEAK
ncbi:MULTISPECIES: EAL domain-containing protein [unclassified Pantoea]|jgi:EAL domain-containing protein (putative c-di-GMP-specific phosphodiesterase class I)|nr:MULTISPECIES: EAL domain-containing protein [unclassified Pantoea]MDF2041175.1 EAL domain-containing protein [Pantoea sp. Cr_R14]MDF2069862.1 EAL domain-containing protein [Pantoea sp. Cr_R13]MDF2078492.1 EAL domain-containing protein [Pantoea sp. Cr_R21]